MKTYSVFFRATPGITSEPYTVQAEKWEVKGPAEGNYVIFYVGRDDVAMFRLDEILGFRVTS